MHTEPFTHVQSVAVAIAIQDTKEHIVGTTTDIELHFQNEV